MGAAWVIPFIILGGALQSVGAAMNGQINRSLVNPWLASTGSFALVSVALWLGVAKTIRASCDGAPGAAVSVMR